MVGIYLCFQCKKRQVVLEKEKATIGLALVERSEHEFQNREVKLTTVRDNSKKEAERFKSELETAKQELAKKTIARKRATGSLSYQLGSVLIQAIRYPGRNTFLLPYRSLRLVRIRLGRIQTELRGNHDFRCKRLAENALKILTAQGTQDAGKYIQKCKVSNAKKANLFEHLLYEVVTDPNDADYFLTEAFELDPTYARGKRLATWGFAHGLVSQPAAIFTRIAQTKERQPSVDIQLAENIKGWNHIKEQLPVIPARQTITGIGSKERTALMFLFCSLPYHSNGYAIRSHGLLSGLKGTSWDVIPCTRPGYPRDVKCHIHPGQSESTEVDEIIYRHLKGPNRQEMGVKDYFDESAEIIEAVARTNRPAVIHAASNHETALPALIAARRMGLPFIYEVRGLWEVTEASTKAKWDDTELFQIQRSLESLIAREADCVITLTSGLRNELISRGVREENIRIVPNCVDVERFQQLPLNEDLHRKLGLRDTPTIGYVGSFVAYEGLDDLIRAAVILRKRGVKFNLLLVGDGKVLKEIQELVKTSDLKKETVITGRIPHQDIEQYYSLIDIAPFPRKPLPVCEMVSPLKPLEAMAMGKAVVASSVWGLKEIVTDRETGLIFEKGNVNDLAEKLAEVVRDRYLAVRLGTNALRWVHEQRSWDSTAGIIAATYDDVISKTRAKPAFYPVHADKHAIPQKGLRLAVYADVNLNIIDGSAIWTASLVEALAGLERASVFLFLKSKENRRLLTDPLRKFSNVTIVDPTETDRLVGGSLTHDAALDKIEAMDSRLNFDAIFLRRFALCERASLRSRLQGRLWTYLTDIPQKSEDLTPSTLQKLDEIARASKYILCQTEEFHSHFQRHVPSAQGRTRILPPIIPAPNLAQEASKGAGKTVKCICCAGKFAPLWGTIEMFNAFTSLRVVHPEVELHIFGDKIHNPPEIPDFQRTVLSYLQNTEGVVWHRGLSREEVLRHMPDMDIGWAWRCPELEAGTIELSTKILEYGSYGLPVILYRNSINENLLGPDYPLYANTYDELVALLHQLFSSPEVLKVASSITQSASEQFTLENVRDKYLRPLFDYTPSQETLTGPAKHPSILVAGHDLKFINRLNKEFSDHGYIVETDNWWRHREHDRVGSERLLEEADIVICEWCLGNAVWYSQNKRPGQKLIVRFHSQERDTDFPKMVDMNSVDKMIFVGPHFRREAIPRFGWESWAEEKIMLIPNYVDVDSLSLPKIAEAQFNLGFCGIVPMRKRLDRALDILEILRREDERFKLHVKGKMPQEYSWMRKRHEELQYYKGLMDRIENSNLLRDAVQFDGWGDDMPQWYQKIGFILSTSDFESFHLSVAEGAASRAVPILLKWEGADEVYPEEWSYKTVEEAAGAILSIAGSSGFKDMAGSGCAFVQENHSIEHVFRAWREMLAGL